MKNIQIAKSFSKLSTPLLADACMRLGLTPRVAPSGIRPTIDEAHIAGKSLPCRHYGSVDVFLEAMIRATEGDVLVIDNGGRDDEACIGDLIALEAEICKLSGIVLWGYHRDSAELREISIPIFSYGTLPIGPQRLDNRNSDSFELAKFGDVDVTTDDIIFGDSDGVLFLSNDHANEVMKVAEQIWATEQRQAKEIRSGRRLSEQLCLESYLKTRKTDPSFTFRQHLRKIGGAIEE